MTTELAALEEKMLPDSAKKRRLAGLFKDQHQGEPVVVGILFLMLQCHMLGVYVSAQ